MKAKKKSETISISIIQECDTPDGKCINSSICKKALANRPLEAIAGSVNGTVMKEITKT
jgi:hypothetical protein